MARWIVLLVVLMSVAGCQSVVVRYDCRHASLAYDVVSQRMEVIVHP